MITRNLQFRLKCWRRRRAVRAIRKAALVLDIDLALLGDPEIIMELYGASREAETRKARFERDLARLAECASNFTRACGTNISGDKNGE